MTPDDFDFALPERLIALTPAEPRDRARLLHVKGDALTDAHVADLPTLLRAGDVVVLNDTRVLPAALIGTRAGRGESADAVRIEINLLHPIYGSQTAQWAAFARPAKRLRDGDRLDFGAGLTAVAGARDGAEVVLDFGVAPAQFDQLLELAGHVPLPPYIARRRAADPADRIRYQTVFARHKGSVAAPTAGLHFTPELLSRLNAAGIAFAHVTLHVGAGTFLPVTASTLDGHKMHREWGRVDASTAEQLRRAVAEGRRIVCVGTTSLRILETAAAGGEIEQFEGYTDIFITPGYRFRTADVLLTNFHLPRSTLLMLVSAFAGVEPIRAAYDHAVASQYRFYSFGDATLLERAR